MTTTQLTDTAALDDLAVPVSDGQVAWEQLSVDEFHGVVRGIIQHLNALEPELPTDGVLERSVQLEATARALAPLQHRYAGLLEDAFTEPRLRSTIELPKGKTPFRDAKDFIAKTHGLRAFEATGRLKLSRSLTPARASDPERDQDLAVGDTQYPLLGALQAEGTLHPSKLATAVNMLSELDEHAATAGKDQAFRDQLQQVVERDLAEKIENTTPEEFSRYVRRRKADLIAAMDPPDQQFTSAQTEAMHMLRCEGPVRGNPNATKWSVVADAELNEALHLIAALLNNPRASTDTASETEKDSQAEQSEQSSLPADESEGIPDRRTRGQRAMHALRDALKFAIANLKHTDLPGTNGKHTQLVVLADYPTLVRHLRDQLGELLPDVTAPRREKLLKMLAKARLEEGNESELGQGSPLATESEVSGIDPPDTPSGPIGDTGSAEVIALPTPPTEDTSTVVEGPPHESPLDGTSTSHEDDDAIVQFPSPKTTNLKEILDDQNLDRLQPRIGHGIYTAYYPPEILLRLLCDVSVSPVTLTGAREILSIGRQQYQFPKAIRRAILARDRGCAVPGCHWPAAWCELHHIEYWSNNGETSTDNGITLCSHHHQSLHAKMLTIEHVDGAWQFIQHPLIDPAQQPRQNYFWQN
ncbi:hypothetical protein GCM10023190_05300 [Enteractinococcus fodinae]|uniref:HNH nuclease domain-containing protein n=1 Tax=Enteractinococcus fodinae TaxID=684663 RepID=A0ABU2B0Q5_9MICC|nr:HNH endonuclease signature motif containing protein [Enteractinococcus fodinae]MDR7346991.1 hypothetical protein [Enteractinococcus fodinae]